MTLMDAQKPTNEIVDDTQIEPPVAEDAPLRPRDGGGEPADPSIELAIEALAGMDAAEAPDLADEVAARLRARLTDR